MITHHRHKPATAKILEKIENHLRKTGGRMTDVRREIVLLMAGFDEPKTAYQILDAANKKRPVKLSAISLYRTLHVLKEAGIVLTLASRNTFELCLNAAPQHSHLMIVCDKCGKSREIHDQTLAHTLTKAAENHGHTLQHHVIELHGICRTC